MQVNRLRMEYTVYDNMFHYKTYKYTTIYYTNEAGFLQIKPGLQFLKTLHVQYAVRCSIML
jgi:hypothetical protein